MKDKETKQLSATEIKELQDQNEIFKSILGKLSAQNDEAQSRDNELDILAKSIDEVIKGEISDISKFTGDDVTTFLYKTLSQDERMQRAMMKSIDDIFNSDNNQSIASIMFDKKRSKNVLLEELDVITSYVHQLKEAVNATRDAIVTSDDIGTQMSRNLKFKNIATDSAESMNAISLIEKMEEELNLHHKIKNHIIPRTLEFGEFYVYTAPYSDLIRDCKNRTNQQNNQKTSINVFESTEHFTNEDFSEYKPLLNSGSNTGSIRKVMDDFLKDIEVCNESTSIIEDEVSINELSVMESGDFYTSNPEFTKQVNGILKKQRKGAPGSLMTRAAGEAVIDSINKHEFSDVTGCLVKLIDPRRLVEVKVLEKVIGYYYVVDTGVKLNKMSFTQSIKLNLASQSTMQKEDLESKFIHMIADKVVSAMDKKYLEDNIKFKELIVNALMYEDTYKRKVKFQFIPVDYITKYTVDEDMEGQGQSILTNSLFYAKLYLYLLIFKVLSILTKSNDQKFHYVKSSGIDKETANSTQSAARAIKENEMTFKDLMNYGTAMNKIGKAKDAWIPTGTQADRPIESDILSGQDIQLNTDLMEMLLTNAINSTGVPSVIMSYINEADYSRTLVMANAKFIGRVVNYQLDFNRCNTELYKKLARYYLNLDENIINSLSYTFASPKSLNNINMSDAINNAEQTANFIVKCYTGENRNPTEEDNALKDIMFAKVVKELLPMIQWSKMDELFKASKEESKQLIVERKASPSQDEL